MVFTVQSAFQLERPALSLGPKYFHIHQSSKVFQITDSNKTRLMEEPCAIISFPSLSTLYLHRECTEILGGVLTFSDAKRRT